MGVLPNVGATVGIVGDADLLGDMDGVIDVGTWVVGLSVPVGVIVGMYGAYVDKSVFDN